MCVCVGCPKAVAACGVGGVVKYQRLMPQILLANLKISIVFNLLAADLRTTEVHVFSTTTAAAAHADKQLLHYEIAGMDALQLLLVVLCLFRIFTNWVNTCFFDCFVPPVRRQMKDESEWSVRRRVAKMSIYAWQDFSFILYSMTVWKCQLNLEIYDFEMKKKMKRMEKYNKVPYFYFLLKPNVAVFISYFLSACLAHLPTVSFNFAVNIINK